MNVHNPIETIWPLVAMHKFSDTTFFRFRLFLHRAFIRVVHETKGVLAGDLFCIRNAGFLF